MAWILHMVPVTYLHLQIHWNNVCCLQRASLSPSTHTHTHKINLKIMLPPTPRLKQSKFFWLSDSPSVVLSVTLSPTLGCEFSHRRSIRLFAGDKPRLAPRPFSSRYHSPPDINIITSLPHGADLSIRRNNRILTPLNSKTVKTTEFLLDTESNWAHRQGRAKMQDRSNQTVLSLLFGFLVCFAARSVVNADGKLTFKLLPHK